MFTLIKKLAIFALVFLMVFMSSGVTNIFATGDSSVSNTASSSNCDSHTNLVVDGGFETPIITNPKLWDIVAIPTAETPWTSTLSNYGVEIQAGVYGLLPYAGAQYAEIDGGIGHEVSQTIPTVMGNTYTLSFVTSDRPGIPLASSTMNVLVNGVLKETLNAPATTTMQTEWYPHTYSFVASGTSTKITFVDAKPYSTGTGMFLDEVKVVCSDQPAPPASAQCVIADPKGDTAKVAIQNLHDEAYTLPMMLSDISPGTDAYTDQKNYQTWNLQSASTTLEVTYEKNGAGGPIVFGYYSTGNPATFVPVFKTGDYAGYESVPTLALGQKISVNADRNAVAFAIKSSYEGKPLFTTETSQNADGTRHALVYDFKNSTVPKYILAFEDIPAGLPVSDYDYNDIVVSVAVPGCGEKDVPPPPVHVNTPPTISIIGANPATTTVGSTYVDPGATATDSEDGNITNKISTTSTVNTSVAGTYSVTYSVTDSGGLSASTTRQVIVNPAIVVPPPSNACDIVLVSDTTNQVVGGGFAVATYSQNDRWTAIIPGATWIWKTFLVPDPSVDEFQTFTKTFNLTSTSTVTSAVLVMAADNSYTVSVNGTQIDASNTQFNYFSENKATINVAPFLKPGANTISFTVKNWALQTTSQLNPAGLLYRLEIKRTDTDCNTPTPANHPPVITILGSNPATVNVGENFVDPGATATDQEDGNITSKIVATSTVNTSVAGTYGITYSVVDSGGLSASTTRTVTVQNPSGGGPTTGKITFCLVLANNNNEIATSSTNLPSGTFSLNVGTSTNIASSTLSSRTWQAMSFTPNTKIILPSGQDAQCQTLDNLPFGAYYYTPLTVTGAQWNTPKYNDQHTQPVNNVFDFFPYSPELFTATTTDDAARNLNSDGHINLDAAIRERTLVMYDTYNPASPAPQCSIPTVASPLTASVTVNNAFAYTLTGTTTTATTTPLTFSVASSTLPAGLSFATSTNTISGTPTTVGTYNITLKTENTCGFDVKTLVLTVLAASGGGGGTPPGADLVVTKTADKTTANAGETITYTISVTNNGPLAATGVTATDILPSTLDFISATSTLGSYATSTGIWTIGNLPNATSTTLTLVATIKAGTAGQKITNNVTVASNQTDSNTGNNTTSVDTTVNTPAAPVCTANCGGGGGGGGGGNGPIQSQLTIFNEQVVETAPGIAFVSWNTTLPASRRVVYGNASQASLGLAPNYGYTNSTELVSAPLATQHGMVIAITPGQTYYFRSISTTTTETALGKELVITGGNTGTGGIGGSIGTTTPTTSDNSCYYLYDFLRKDFNNNPVEVKKLQIFLKTLEGFSNLEVTGVYDDATIAAVDQFQIRYKDEILLPWGYDGTTGTDYTYILTKKKVNEIYCKHAFPVTPQEQAEIDATRALFEGLRAAGIEIGNQPPSTSTETPIQNNIVGSATSTGSSSLGVNSSTLAGVSSTTQNIASRMTANVLSAGKKLGSLALAFFTWPFGSGTLNSVQNGFRALGNNLLSWLILFLVLAIILIAYLWYREYGNNKEMEEAENMEELNKEIDLK